MENATFVHVQEYFGKKVRERRKQLKMSQQQLAQSSHLHWTYISSLERGERNVSILNIAKISKALDSPMKEFFPEL